jgi:hypothetical protein
MQGWLQDVYIGDFGTVRIDTAWAIAKYGEEAVNKMREGKTMETPCGPARIPDWANPTLQDIAKQIDPWMKAQWDAGKVPDAAVDVWPGCAA